jgi:NADH-quinone oxidoreductase subunit N
MTAEMPDFALLAPEIFVLGMACLILIIDLFLDDEKRIASYALAQITLIGAALLSLGLNTGHSTVAMHGTYVSDPMSAILKVFIALISAGVFLYSRRYLAERGLFRGEYYVLGLFAVLGMMILVSAHNFLTIYLGLELLSLALYAMVAFERDSPVASEAAMKYFVLGALASGMLLYGISMLYGVTGSLDIEQVGAALAKPGESGIVLVFALCFVVVGLAFKLGAVPFHMWIPDVYHGAPTPVTLFIGSAPKIAAFAMVMRMLADSLGALHTDWQAMLVVLAVLSMAIGNVIAIAQSNIKRMLAYSTISHVGFLILGILAGTPQGYSAAMFYIITYAMMAIGAFGMIILLSRSGFEADRLEDFKGLNDRSPWFAFMMLIMMFSMAGVPPTVGFYAKLSVLEAVVRVDMIWLALVAVLFSIIGAFYYLRVVKLMYFDKVEGEVPPLMADLDMRVAMSVNGAVVLGLGIFPGGLLALCNAAMA